jgi:dihydroxyacid dehydratase/phosphogluconate dehydratase
LRDGDVIRVEIDCRQMTGAVDLVGETGRQFTPEEGRAVLAARATRPDLAPHTRLPDDTRLWAALQAASGGAWAGCVYDADRIAALLRRG